MKNNKNKFQLSLMSSRKKQLISIFFFAILFLITSGKLISQTIWTGSVDNDWNNDNNWSAGVPIAGIDAEIAANVPNAPTIYTSGAECNSLILDNGSILSMNAGSDLSVYGNWSNYGTFTAYSGEVIFKGGSSQLLIGTTTFFDLKINNSSGLELGINTDITVDDYLTFTLGNIVTHNNRVNIDLTGNVIVNNGFVDGNETKYVSVGNGDNVYFEIGSASEFAPVELYFNNVSAPGTIIASTIKTDDPNIISSGINSSFTINRYWKLSNTTSLSFDTYNVELNYQTQDEDSLFNYNNAGVMIYSGGNWNYYEAHNSTLNYIDVINVTQIGDIQIGDVNPSPSLYSLSITEAYISQTLNIEFTGSNFITGISAINAPSGITINSLTVNSDSVITANISIAPNAALGDVLFAVTNSGLGGGTSDSLAFTIKGRAVANFFASSTNIKCYVSGSVDFINTSINADSYLWNFGAGASPATATGYGPFTVSYSSTGSKTIKLIAYSPAGNDSITRTNYINVTASAPTTPTLISGPTDICSYGTGNVTYTTPAVIGVTSYNWTIPGGVTLISGQGTTSLTVKFGPTFISGNISLKEINGCGTSGTRTLSAVRIPAIPGAMTGPTQVCSLTSATYSVVPVTGAVSYTWTLPAGITGTSSTNSINVSISHPAFIGGSISVKANNSCGGSGPSRTLTFTTTIGTPGLISGPINNFCFDTVTYTYSIAAVPGAISYIWSVPTGCTINGTLTNILATPSPSIAVTYPNTFISGSIQVRASNGCTAGGIRSLAVKVSPPIPGAISGLTCVCTLVGSNNTTAYSVATVPGVNNYSWIVPAGATLVSGQGTTTISVSFSSSFIFGNISVISMGTCAKSSAKTLSVGISPGAIGLISGNTSICSQIYSATPVAYSINPVSGATSYTWTAPSGSIITGSSNNVLTTTSTSISVVFDALTPSGSSLQVVANNSCTNTPPRNITLSTCLSPTGIVSATNTNNFSALYPNPTSDVFNIDINTENDTEMKTEVYDALGNIVIEQKFELSTGKNIATINVQMLPKGMYFVKLIDLSTNKEESKKLIKQ